MTKQTHHGQQGKTRKASRETAQATQAAAPTVARQHVAPVDVDEMPDQPFAEGSQDSMDPDLRHRLVSEAAYRRYVERGYEDGYDMEDWLQAEAEIDHVVVNR
jgi:hypothetical protein